MIKRISVFTYGVIAYAIFVGVFAYALGFVGNFLVPKSIDSPPQIPLAQALLVNLLVLGVFAIQHSVMARPAFKHWLTRFVPKPAERSNYVMMSNLAMIVLFVFWQPLGGTVWNVEDPLVRNLLHAVMVSGWLLVFVSTLFINHFDLFGLRQVWLYLRGREYSNLEFGRPGFYRWVRHPLYVGWFIFFWATPTMTVTHLLFAVMTTLYILVAVRLEERDLIAEHGQSYLDYRAEVPRLIPGTKLGTIAN